MYLISYLITAWHLTNLIYVLPQNLTTVKNPLVVFIFNLLPTLGIKAWQFIKRNKIIGAPKKAITRANLCLQSWISTVQMKLNPILKFTLSVMKSWLRKVYRLCNKNVTVPGPEIWRRGGTLAVDNSLDLKSSKLFGERGSSISGNIGVRF